MTNERLFINDINYIFISERDIINDKKLREVLYNDYKVSPEIIQKIHKRVQNTIKDKLTGILGFPITKRDKSQIKQLVVILLLMVNNTEM